MQEQVRLATLLDRLEIARANKSPLWSRTWGHSPAPVCPLTWLVELCTDWGSPCSWWNHWPNWRENLLLHGNYFLEGVIIHCFERCCDKKSAIITVLSSHHWGCRAFVSSGLVWLVGPLWCLLTIAFVETDLDHTSFKYINIWK